MAVIRKQQEWPVACEERLKEHCLLSPEVKKSKS